MKERRGVDRLGDPTSDSSFDAREQQPRRRWWSEWEESAGERSEHGAELARLYGSLLGPLDPTTLARLSARSPGKVTRVERELLLAELGGGKPSPEAAFRYAQWLLSDERGWSERPRQPERAMEQREGLLASAFGFLARIARFEDFRQLGQRQMVAAAEAHGGGELRDATLSASAGRGRAMWQAGQRRGAMLYRRAIDDGALADDGPEVATALQRCGNGQALPASVQRTMEAKLGVSLARVRVHTDEVADQAARAVHAEAFTVGEDIFFARGAFAPGTATGDRLLAHELTHVVQAWQGRSEPRGGDEPRVSRPGDTLEREAEAVAERVERGERNVLGEAKPAPAPQPAAAALDKRQPGAAPASALLSPSPLPLLPPHAQRLLRRAVQPARPRGSVPSVRGGMGKRRPDGNAQSAQQEMRGASGEFTRKARQSTERSAEKLGHGLSAAKAMQPGKKARAHAKNERRAARAGEQEARERERQQHRKAEERAGRDPEVAELPTHKGEAVDTRSPIQLKAIDDWSRYMPTPLPDQDERERARIEQLVKKKIQGERRQAQSALEQLRTAHLKQARDVRASKPRLLEQVAKAQKQAMSKVASAEAAQSGAVRSHVAAMQGQVRGHAVAMKAQVASAHRAAITKIEATHKAANDKLTKSKTKALDDVKHAEALALLLCSMDFLSARSRFTSLGSRKAGDAITVGEEESGKMSGRWDGEKLEAAQKAARETADGFASSMTEQAAAALGQIEATRLDAEQGLRDLATTTRENIEKSYQASKQALDEAHQASVRSADAASQAAQAQIDQACNSTVASLGAHGASQVAAIAKQAQGARSGIASGAAAARTGAAKMCDQAATGIERGVIGLVRGARQIEAPNPEETQQQVREGTQSLERGSKDVAKGLSKTASESASGLLQQASSAADGMASVATAAKASATQMAAGAQQQMSGIARGASQSLGQIAEAHKTSSDEKVKAAETGFADQVKALRESYEEAGKQRAKQLDDNYNQCADALSKAVPDRGGGRGGGGSGKKGEEGGESGGAAKDEIASIQENAQKAADAVKPWWQKALAVVVSIVVAVVVVIVVTALIATTGPVGMILVGAAAGALASVAGTMASNLVLGNGVFDGITWQSVLIGAIGGGIGAGLTAGLGAGAGALAQSARFAGTAVGRGAQATATAIKETAKGFGQLALKTGIEAGSDFVSEQAANLIVNQKLDITVEGLVLSLVTSAATSHPKFDAFQSSVQTGIQKHTPIRVDLPKLQIQIGSPQAPGAGGADGGVHAGDGGGDGGRDGAGAGPNRDGNSATTPRPEGANPRPDDRAGGATGDGAGRDGDKPGRDGGKPDKDGGKPDKDGGKPDKDGGSKPDKDGANPGKDGGKPDKDGAKPDKDGDTTHGDKTKDNDKSDSDTPGKDNDKSDSDASDADPVSTRDSALDELGYPEGTRAKADELAAKVEQGERPPKDVLRDTEANQRGTRELQELLADPTLTPEQKAKLQQDLATRLREQSDPTGNLQRDIAEAHARAKQEDDSPSPDGNDKTSNTDTGASSGISDPNSTYRGDAVARDNSHNVRAGVEEALASLGSHFPPDTVRPLGPDRIEIMIGGRPQEVRIEVVPKDLLAKPTDVANFDVSQTPPVIRVSGNAQKAHVERALAHEVAEVRSILESRDSNTPRTTADTLKQDGNGSELSHNDLGRLAELRVLMADLSNPQRPKAKTRAEMYALLSELGLINPNGSLAVDRPALRRMSLVESEGIRLDDVAAALAGGRDAPGDRATLYNGLLDEPTVNRMVADVGDGTLRALETRLTPQQIADMYGAGGADSLRTVHEAVVLEKDGRLTGLNDWMEFTKAKDTTDLRRAIGELREASRLAHLHPGQVINIGGDKRAPRRANQSPMKSFDITVEAPDGTVSHSVEVTTVDNPVSQKSDVTTGVRHAADKAASRQTEGEPIPGQREATIRMQLAVGDARIGGGRTRQITPDGEVRIIDGDGNFRPRPGNPTNIFDDIAANLNQGNISNLEQLDRITLTDSNTGAVIAVFERDGTTWRRAP